MKGPTVYAELDAGSRRLPLFRGKLIGCWPVPVEIKGINESRFPESVWLGPGETLEYWLVVAEGREWYETRVHPVDCPCGGRCVK